MEHDRRKNLRQHILGNQGLSHLTTVICHVTRGMQFYHWGMEFDCSLLLLLLRGQTATAATAAAVTGHQSLFIEAIEAIIAFYVFTDTDLFAAYPLNPPHGRERIHESREHVYSVLPYTTVKPTRQPPTTTPTTFSGIHSSWLHISLAVPLQYTPSYLPALIDCH